MRPQGQCSIRRAVSNPYYGRSNLPFSTSPYTCPSQYSLEIGFIYFDGRYKVGRVQFFSRGFSHFPSFLPSFLSSYTYLPVFEWNRARIRSGYPSAKTDCSARFLISTC